MKHSQWQGKCPNKITHIVMQTFSKKNIYYREEDEKYCGILLPSEKGYICSLNLKLEVTSMIYSPNIHCQSFCRTRSGSPLAFIILYCTYDVLSDVNHETFLSSRTPSIRSSALHPPMVRENLCQDSLMHLRSVVPPRLPLHSSWTFSVKPTQGSESSISRTSILEAISLKSQSPGAC